MKKIMCIVLVILLLVAGAVSVSANDNVDYEDAILEKLGISSTVKDDNYYKYIELYKCFVEEETVPEYVLVFLNPADFAPAHSCGVFGDYVVREWNLFYPYELGYYVYLPAEGEVYTLREAWCAEISNIDRVFSEGIIGELIGDVDKDNRISVKDATMIQKSIAGIKQQYEDTDSIGGFYDDETVVVKYLSDFNRDRVRNIKDATAIQKYLAGIVE